MKIVGEIYILVFRILKPRVMASVPLEEFILVIAAVVIGIVMFGFIGAVLIPSETLSMAESQASALASSSSLSVGPLLINNGVGSAVVEFYNPSLSTNVTILAFAKPSYYAPSLGMLTPSSQPSFYVYLPNGKLAKTLTIDRIYDVNGKVIYASPITVYTVPANTPVTIKINGITKDDILVIWVIYKVGDYWFRISFTFTGVPS